MRSKLISTALLSIVFFVPVLAFAQASSFAYDETRLITLYESYVKKNMNDTYLEKRIADERSKVRALADEDIKQIVTPVSTDVTSEVVTALPTAIDRQRTIVTALESQLREEQVDLDLLKEEGRKFYTASGAIKDTSGESRLTKTYPELLAKVAILEERMAALETALPLQRDRYSKLSWQQSMEQFGFFSSFLSYAVILLVGIALDRLMRLVLMRRLGPTGKRYHIAKILSAVIYVFTAVWFLSKLFGEHPGAISSLAIIGAGVAIAMQDIVKDAVGWLIILQKRPFTLGDRISIGQSTGDVIDISLLRTAMLEVSTTGVFNALERTGKTLYFPNSMILIEPVLNYNTTSDFMNAETQVTVTYESNWHKAEQIVRESLKAETAAFAEQAKKQHKRRTALFYTASEVGDPEVHVDMAQNGILFTLKFTIPIGQRRTVVTKLTRTILERFELEPDIHLAFNTLRVIGDSPIGRK